MNAVHASLFNTNLSPVQAEILGESEVQICVANIRVTFVHSVPYLVLIT